MIDEDKLQKVIDQINERFNEVETALINKNKELTIRTEELENREDKNRYFRIFMINYCFNRDMLLLVLLDSIIHLSIVTNSDKMVEEVKFIKRLFILDIKRRYSEIMKELKNGVHNIEKIMGELKDESQDVEVDEFLNEFLELFGKYNEDVIKGEKNPFEDFDFDKGKEKKDGN